MPEFNENFNEFVARIGEPFNIATTIIASHTMQYFTLGGGDDTGTDFDWNGDGTDEDAPFDGLMLMITGAKVWAPTAGSASVQYLNIDGKNVLGSIIAGGEVWHLNGADDNMDAAGPTLLGAWGHPWLCRRRIGLKVADGDQMPDGGATNPNGIRIELWGYAVDRRF